MKLRDPRIYLDYNATAPLLPAARDALVGALDLLGNPSSVHSEGRAARAVVEKAREDVAALVEGASEAVVFTSGATEGAALCLAPQWIRHGRETAIDSLAVIETDHSAIREGGRFPGDKTFRLPVDASGILDFEAFDRWLATLPADRTAMLAVCWANNETGVIQPIAAIRERIGGRNVVLVVDAVQVAGRLPIRMDVLAADALILSGHKIGAVKGIGAVVFKSSDVRPFPVATGGGQERGLRPGTEAVPLLASFGVAARNAAATAGKDEARHRELGCGLLEMLTAAGCLVQVLGDKADRLANTLCLAAPGLKAETAQIALDLQGIAVSAGAACSSGKVAASHVVQAMADGGCPVDPANGAIRVSMGEATSKQDIEAFARAFAALAHRARPERRAA